MTEVEEVVNREVLVGSIGAASGLVVGGIAGYFLAKRNLEVKYATLANEEIAEMREHYRNAKAIAAEPKPDLQEVVEELGYSTPEDEEMIVIPSPEAIELVEATPENIVEAVESNVFVEAEPESEWNWEKEQMQRSEITPYILHIDEFTQNEREYEQTTLTYFEGDDVLCDERDTIIDDREELVGSELLERFGHGSGDNNVLYVRNPVREIDIEIVKSTGSYGEEVHGFIQHNEEYRRPRVRRGFDDDEIT